MDIIEYKKNINSPTNEFKTPETNPREEENIKYQVQYAGLMILFDFLSISVFEAIQSTANLNNQMTSALIAASKILLGRKRSIRV
jgi:hypothetical protein